MQNRFKIGQRVRFIPSAWRTLGRRGETTVIAWESGVIVKVSVDDENTTFHESWLEPIPFEEYYNQLKK